MEAEKNPEASTVLDRIRVRHLLFVCGLSFFGAVAAFGFMEGVLSVDGPTAVVGGRAVYAPVVGWLGWVIWKHGLDLAVLFGPVPTSLHAWGAVGAAVVGIYLVGRVDTHLVVPFLESVLVASVLEKVLFRGVIFQRWAHARKRPVEALLAASVLFALVHGLTLNSFVFGAVAVLLGLQVRSLWAPIAMHAALNGPAIAGGPPIEKGAKTLGGGGDQAAGWLCLAASAGILGWFVRRQQGTLRGPLPYVEREDRGQVAETH